MELIFGDWLEERVIIIEKNGLKTLSFYIPIGT